MDVKIFASAHTEQLHNDGDISGLKLKLKNEKTKVLAALLTGMEKLHAAKVGQRMLTPAVVWAIASLYSDARAKNPALKAIDNPWRAADAYLAVHQEARVDAMCEPDRKKPARVLRTIRFDEIDFVQHFDKHVAPAALDKKDSTVQQSGLPKPRPRRRRAVEMMTLAEMPIPENPEHTIVLTPRVRVKP